MAAISTGIDSDDLQGPLTRGAPIIELLRYVRAHLREAGFDEEALEAEALVSHALAVDSAWLYGHPEAPVGSEPALRVEEFLRRRLRHEPLAYIRGFASFYGRDFAVDRRVLIPRPETESLVDLALAWLGRPGLSRPLDGTSALGIAPALRVESEEPARRVRVADIGTGSGVLAITLALEIGGETRGRSGQPAGQQSLGGNTGGGTAARGPRTAGGYAAEVHAVDESAGALEVATANAERHGVAGSIRFHLGDLGGPLVGCFDVIVANLPYIRTKDLDNRQPELGFEPRSALDGGVDGMRYVGALADDLPRLVARPGIALLEIDPPIARLAEERAKQAFARHDARHDVRQVVRHDRHDRHARHGRSRAGRNLRIEVLKDLNGLERVLEVIL